MGFSPLYYIDARVPGSGAHASPGQAVSFYRGLGRTSHWWSGGAPDGAARQFYEKHGFLKSAEGQIGPLSLDVLEKYISYDAIMAGSLRR